ncbi:Crp/Fnr family transcriptional regulator [Streptomyces sp. DSM 44915]|uniref:Crp/Fnr family transcriptional regulator n=1 Tax=Streptomyces chisholmiae TaxID=3075540 RepID=A0ABU2JU17_9ACTN|nr:Crp/Fnr family transcriptional regulator [Streptomyces sp. DSM 44915]MDT0267698.1 Crp/Fnr family transcriptional regulator [Streptomyces sp. DSM 44915]
MTGSTPSEGVRFPFLQDRVPFLACLEDQQRAELLGLGPCVTYKPRTEIIRQHEPSSHVQLIVRGRLMVTTGSPNGYVALLALRRPGDVVGESAALTGQARSATVTTLEAAECVLVTREAFLEFLARHPSAHQKLSALLVHRIRAGDRRALELASMTVRERLAVLLLDLARSHSEPTERGLLLTVPLSQQEMAGSIGASREAIVRLLAELRGTGVLVTARRKVWLRRPEVLRRIVGGDARG